MPHDPHRNIKFRVYQRRRYLGTSNGEKAAIKKVTEASVEKRSLIKEQKRVENKIVQETITADKFA
jgi:hypothetical protein